MSFHFTSHLNLCEIFSEDERYSRTDHSIIFKVNKYIGTIFHPLNDHDIKVPKKSFGILFYGSNGKSGGVKEINPL